MRSKRIPAEEQYRLIVKCRQSGLTDHQWCVEHDIKPGTFYNWVKRLRPKGCVDFPASTGRSYRAPESKEVVRVDFHDTDPIPYEPPLNVIPVSTERNNLSVAAPMKLSVVNILVYGNHNSGNVETDIPVVGNRLNSAWVIVPCIDVICPALAA